MASSTPLPLALARFRQLPQRSNETWQGGLVKLPIWIDNPHDRQGPPYRPTGALWVSLRTGLLHLTLPDPGIDATPAFAVKALIEFGLKESKRLDGRPSVVEIRDSQLEPALTATMSPLNTSVRLVREMPAVDDTLRNFEADAGGGLRQAGMLEDTGVTVDQLRDFAAAAATFFSAAPWRHLTNADLIVVSAPHMPKGMRHLCVLGNGGEQFGLAFFDSRKDFERTYSGDVLPHRAFGITYGPIHDLPFADVDAWEDLGLPVADSQSYPLAADLASNGTVRRLNAGELVAAGALLRALAQTSEAEMDAGSWRQVVDMAAEPVTLELSLPLMLEAERGAPTTSNGGLAEADAAIMRAEADGLFEQSPEIAAGRSLTPLEQAQELADDAMDATGRLRMKLARRALAVSADCVDAYVILGDLSARAEEALEWYARGVEAAARAIGADNFAALRGKFWGCLETRPYMRVRLALAQTLLELGREQEALDHYRELLGLNPDDNQGVRYLLLPALLERSLYDEADGLLGAYHGDMQAMWPYAQALRAFQRDGDGSGAHTALATAIRLNPHVVRYLLDPDTIPPVAPPHFSLGSREEAGYVADCLEAAFRSTPGALAWLRTTNQAVGRRRGRQGNRSRRN
jgi:tetratricopeptide (TPR) repeat protein